jgi:GDP-4-dehydro-6-deoxy-D-mannose reductase
MDGKKIIISGINGFVGHYLAHELHNAGLSVIGVGRESTVNPDISDIVAEYHQADLVKSWPDIADAQAIIHLAGLAVVAPSFEKPQVYINSNSAMVINLCEYYLKNGQKPRIIIVSSGAIYSPNQPMPIAENGEIGFSSPYAVSKVLNENLVSYYRRRGLDCITVRPFNHIGPGQTTGFILPDLYSRLSSLGKNEDEIITGNIKTKRDYTDVRDIVRAYHQIAVAKSLKHEIYNICSGKSLSGAEIFNLLKSTMQLTNVNYKIDKSLVRPSDIMDNVGDASRLTDELGWQPQIDIRQTVVDFVESKLS